MKKAIFSILAVLTVLALVMTGCPTPTTGGKGLTSFTVTFDKNGGDTEADPATLNGGASGVGTLPTAPTKTGFTFKEWNTKADGTGTAFIATTPVTAAITVYAKWEASQFTVTFDKNGGTTEANPATKQGGATGVGTLPADPTKTGSTFKEWNTKADGTGTAFTAATPVTAAITVYAQWEVIELIEKVTLANGCQVIYRFDLPSGKKYSDYEGVSAEYMIGTAEEFEVENSGRAIRLYGNYDMDFFQFNTTTAGNKYAYASMDGSANNNAYILDDTGSGGWKTLKNALIAELGECPAAGAWFKIDYKTDGTRSNQKPHPHLPADADTGPFIFGLGLPGQGTKNTFFMKNVTLKGKTAGTDLLGKPLFISKDSFDYPAFSAYGTADGSGVDDVSRTATQGTYPPAWPAVAPPTYTITFNINATDGSPAFTAETGLTIAADGKTATKTVEKSKTITFPKATRNDNYVISYWGKTATAAEADKVAESATFTENTTLYALWKLQLPGATADLVITPKIDSFGGLGSINHDAGYGPHKFDTTYTYDAMLWFGLTAAVETATYKSVQIKFTAVKADGTDVTNPAKLAFHLGRASETYSGGTAKYVDVTVTDVNAASAVEQTQSWELDDLTVKNGILIQHNKSGSSTFNFQISEIKLLKP